MNLGNPSMLKQAGRWATRIQTVCYEFMFRPIGPGRLAQIGHTLVLGLIYLAGAFHWAWLMNYGNVTYKYIDWQKFYDYYAVIQKALLDKAVPFFIPHFYKGTNQFLAIPETDLSPAVFLLKYMSVKEFFLTQCLILYTLGFIGGLWFRKRYRWSLFTFIFFSLLFNLNGHIVSHLAISHWPWVSYFLLPFFVAWVMKLVEGDRSLWHGTKLAWVLFGIMLLGGLHPFVWCLIFLGLLCLYQRSFIKPILMGVALGGVFSTYRFVPAFITFFGYKNEFASGFPSIPDFLASLVVIKDYNNFIGPLYGKISRIAWWELDHYVGVAGLAAILYFGIYLRIKNKNEGETHDYRVLDLSMATMTVLSMSYIYGIFTYLPIPLITVERVSARFFIVPLLILLVLACIGMQRQLDRVRLGWHAQFLALAVLVFEGFRLFNHSYLWQVRTLQEKMKSEPVRLYDPVSEWAQSVEWLYVPAVKVSYLVSLLALVSFGLAVVYLKRKGRLPQKQSGAA